MSMLTHALTISARPQAFRASAVVGLVAGMIVVAGLLIAHVQLRFEINNLGMETRELQKKKDDLENRANQLASEVEGAKSGDRVLKFARQDLGMVSYNPADAENMTVSRERIDAWRACQPYAPARLKAKSGPSGVFASVEPALTTMVEAVKAKVAAKAASNS